MSKSNLTRKQKRVLRRQKLRTKYRLSIMNEKTFAEAFYMRLSIYNVFLIVATLSLILILIVYLVIAYTPLKEYVIPNYPELEEREKIEKNAELVGNPPYRCCLRLQEHFQA